MNTGVIVKRRQNPPIIEVRDSPGADPLRLTRIWMAVVPPTHEPGYACAVGEIYDADLRQRVRPVILLDETQALNPEDFNPDEREQWADLLYVNPDDAPRRPRRDMPTLADLRVATVALKDLYIPLQTPKSPIYEFCFTPPGPTNDQFFRYLQATEGLGMPPPDDVDDEDLAATWFPFYRRRTHCIAVNNAPPFGENIEYADSLVASLVAGDTLAVNDHCTLFRDRSLENPRRALGMVVAAMQAMDWTWQLREAEIADGYENPTPQDIEEMEAEAARRIENRLYMAGIPVARTNKYKPPLGGIHG